MVRQFPASNAWGAVFKNVGLSHSSLKVTKLSRFKHFSYLKSFSVFIINVSTILSSKYGKIKDGNVELYSLFVVMIVKIKK